MWYLVVPKMLKNKKLNLWVFQRRVYHPYILPRSKLTRFETFMILRNLKVLTKMRICALKYIKSSELQQNMQTYPDIQIIRATRRLKAQTSYFMTRIFLGTIVVPMVPKKSSLQLNTENNEKHAHLTHK